MRIQSHIKLTALLAATAACLLLPAQALAQRAVPVDRVVAVVNNEVVTALELRERVQAAIRQLQQRGIEAPPLEVLEEQVLERMIIERAQLQLAAETGLRLDEATVDRAIASIARNNDLTEDELRAVLAEDGISWTRFREEIRTELTITRLREREVESQIVVTEAEIDNFITNNPDAFSGEELFVAHVLIRMPEAPSQADLARYMARADEVLARHAAGEDFAQLAAAYSDAPDSTQGGGLGWRSRDRLPGLFAEAVRTLRPGEVSPVLRSPAGLHIVKFVAVRGGELAGGVDEMEQTRARHILIRTTEVLSDAEAEARLLGLRERMIQGGERLEELARIHSDDLSAARGGDLGWIYPGDTVPEFERAMDALSPGEISQPIRSPFGWHLIEVVERRVQDVSDERMRATTRNALRERKADEAYDAWLRELRDSTFVEYRLETDF